MQEIKITRSGGVVEFETVSIDTTENVFFNNLDTEAAHWPTISESQVDKAPSKNSSQCVVPIDTKTGGEFTYGCKLHDNEKGIIQAFPPLAAATTTLKPATKGDAITGQQVVKGGKSPYVISGELYEIKDINGSVIQSGAGIGPGLKLNASTTNDGISVTGTPTVSGTYNFTFEVDDDMDKNLQQVQYTMPVA